MSLLVSCCHLLGRLLRPRPRPLKTRAVVVRPTFLPIRNGIRTQNQTTKPSKTSSLKMLLFTMDLSLPILLAAFSLCTSMLAVLGTVQLVISAPAAAHARQHLAAHHHHHHPAQHSQYAKNPTAAAQTQTFEMGLPMQKRVTPWWGTTRSPTDPGFVPLESRPPLSMAKLIMFRHAETQRKANARARTRLAQMSY